MAPGHSAPLATWHGGQVSHGMVTLVARIPWGNERHVGGNPYGRTVLMVIQAIKHGDPRSHGDL